MEISDELKKQDNVISEFSIARGTPLPQGSINKEHSLLFENDKAKGFSSARGTPLPQISEAARHKVQSLFSESRYF